MVKTARPATCQPSKGQLRLRLAKRSASTVQVRWGSMTVMSAAAPGINPQGNPKTRAGATVSLAMRSVSGRTPSATSRRLRGKAVSRPMIPLAAWSNSTSFSRMLWGA